MFVLRIGIINLISNTAIVIISLINLINPGSNKTDVSEPTLNGICVIVPGRAPPSGAAQAPQSGAAHAPQSGAEPTVVASHL